MTTAELEEWVRELEGENAALKQTVEALAGEVNALAAAPPRIGARGGARVKRDDKA